MSQADVLDFLEKNPKKWFTSKEIKKGLGKDGFSSVHTNLRKLRFSGYVLFKELKMIDSKCSYKYKHLEDKSKGVQDAEKTNKLKKLRDKQSGNTGCN